MLNQQQSGFPSKFDDVLMVLI